MARRSNNRHSGGGASLPLLLPIAASIPLTLFIAFLLGERRVTYWLSTFEALGGALLFFLGATAAGKPRYRVKTSSLRIEAFSGGRRSRKRQVKSAKLVRYRLGFKISGWAMPGYYLGCFQSNLGAVTACVGLAKGRGPLLEVVDGRKPPLNPQRPEERLGLLGLRMVNHEES